MVSIAKNHLRQRRLELGKFVGISSNFSVTNGVIVIEKSFGNRPLGCELGAIHMGHQRRQATVRCRMMLLCRLG